MRFLYFLRVDRTVYAEYFRAYSDITGENSSFFIESCKNESRRLFFVKHHKGVKFTILSTEGAKAELVQGQALQA